MMYQQSAAMGATPLGQIVALYDTILRDFGRAIAAMKHGEIETRVFECNHAAVVIGHLMAVLDHHRGGDAAKQFERFYKVTLGMIVKANFNPSVEAFEELIELFSGMRQAWYEAEQTARMSAAAVLPSEHDSIEPGHVDGPTPSPIDSEAPQHHWST